ELPPQWSDEDRGLVGDRSPDGRARHVLDSVLPRRRHGGRAGRRSFPAAGAPGPARGAGAVAVPDSSHGHVPSRLLDVPAGATEGADAVSAAQPVPDGWPAAGDDLWARPGQPRLQGPEVDMKEVSIVDWVQQITGDKAPLK